MSILKTESITSVIIEVFLIIYFIFEIGTERKNKFLKKRIWKSTKYLNLVQIIIVAIMFYSSLIRIRELQLYLNSHNLKWLSEYNYDHLLDKLFVFIIIEICVMVQRNSDFVESFK